MKQRATIRDVAELAGVSISTVSRVLNGKDTVDPSLREKVLEAVRKLNFQPSKVAQSFRKKAQQVSIIVEEWAEPFLRILSAVVEELKQFEIYVNLSVDVESSCSDFAVLISEHPSKDERISLQIGCEREGLYVFFDHDAALKRMVEQFVSLGKRSFALLSESLSNYRAYKLYASFVKAMFRYGIDKYEFLEVSEQKGVMGLSFLPDVVFCSNDCIALQTISSLREEGIDVPAQVSVVGYGNFGFSQFTSPSITTVEYMTKEDGQICAELINKLVNGLEIEKKTILKTKIISRGSALISV